jgi:hypothetical protein
MLLSMNPSAQPDYPLDARGNYRILIRGTLDASWSNRLGDMTVSAARLADGMAVTTLTGELVDQSALVGVLNTLHDLGLSIESVEHVSAEALNGFSTSANR